MDPDTNQFAIFIEQSWILKVRNSTAIVPKILHRIPLFAAAVSNRQSHLVIQERAGEGAQQFLHI